MRGLPSLRSLGTAVVVLAFVAGLAGAWLWTRSNAAWRAHLAEAQMAGLGLYHALVDGTAAPEEVRIAPLPAADAELASAGRFLRIEGVQAAARRTIVPISPDPQRRGTGPLTLVILTPDLQYPLADLTRRPGQTAAETTGTVTRLLASYCADPVVLARIAGGPWMRVDGGAVWGCDAAPADRRLLAGLLMALTLAGLVTAVANGTAPFSDFAAQLRSRQRLGGPGHFRVPGPADLQQIVAAVNDQLAQERANLESRAAVLSGVSHDLGTPATRLRLRTALIEDADLRAKLEGDIDRMTEMIESVLTFTRAEMNTEAPRRLSLTSLLEAIVADYQDTGRRVEMGAPAPRVLRGGRSVFMSRQGQGTMPEGRNVVVTARPVALERAVSNLIDNALKYGRRATVSIETTPQTASIRVDDEGAETTAAEIEALMSPFQRGANAATISGFGLGLTVVNAIARLHGGTLSFEDMPQGLRARLTIPAGA